jgi:ribulose-bisphosphate carboxylase large chain
MVLGALKKVRIPGSHYSWISLLWGHKGSEFGIEEAREILGIFGCPLLGTSVKPKLGLNPSESAAIVAAAVRPAPG